MLGCISSPENPNMTGFHPPWMSWCTVFPIENYRIFQCHVRNFRKGRIWEFAAEGESGSLLPRHDLPRCTLASTWGMGSQDGRKRLGSPPFISHKKAIWKGSHNPILRGLTNITMVIKHVSVRPGVILQAGYVSKVKVAIKVAIIKKKCTQVNPEDCCVIPGALDNSRYMSQLHSMPPNSIAYFAKSHFSQSKIVKWMICKPFFSAAIVIFFYDFRIEVMYHILVAYIAWRPADETWNLSQWLFGGGLVVWRLSYLEDHPT